MTEEERLKTDKNIVTNLELYMTLKAKCCDYRALETPVIYNLYSVNDETVFIKFNRKSKLYDLMATSNIQKYFLKYMPLSYGSKFDKVKNGGYAEIHRMFKELVKKCTSENFIKWSSVDELYKSIKIANQG